MTNSRILEIALQQSAVDLNCAPQDFCSGTAKVVLSRANPQARRYLKLPFFCDMVSYGSNVVVSADERIKDFMETYIRRCPPEHCFETPQLHLLEREFQKYGQSVCFMAEYFLPDLDRLKPAFLSAGNAFAAPSRFCRAVPAAMVECLVPEAKGTGPSGCCRCRQRDDRRTRGSVGRLRYDVADWNRCAARIPQTGNCSCTDGKAGSGNSGTKQGAVLLRGMVKHPLCPKCCPVRLPPGMGGADGHGHQNCQRSAKRAGERIN